MIRFPWVPQVLRLRASEVDSTFLSYLSAEIAKLRTQGAEAAPVLRFLVAVRERVVAEVRPAWHDFAPRALVRSVTCDTSRQLQIATTADADFISALLR